MLVLASCGGRGPALDGSGGGSVSVPAGRVGGSAATDPRQATIAFCLYDANGQNYSRIKYVLRDEKCATFNPSSNASLANFQGRIPYAGQMAYKLSSGNTITYNGKAVSHPERIAIIDSTFNSDLAQSLTSDAHGDRVRRYVLQESFFSNETAFNQIDACAAQDEDDPELLDGSKIVACRDGLGSNKIVNTSFSNMGDFFCPADARDNNWIIVTAAGNTRADTSPSVVPVDNGISVCASGSNERQWSTSDWNEWRDNYRLIIVSQATVNDDGRVNLLQTQCGYTQDRCVVAINDRGDSGSSFSAPQVSAMLSNLYAIWNHLWKDDDPNTNANESDPELLVKLLLECTTDGHQTSRVQPAVNRNEIGQGLVTYFCLMTARGEITLPSGFAAPSSDAVGGLMVRNAEVQGNFITIFDSYRRDFPYRFSSSFHGAAPLWRIALLHDHSSSRPAYFAAHGVINDERRITLIHDNKEGSVFMTYDMGILLGATFGTRGGNDFDGSGVFQLRQSFKGHLGYHRCHAIAESHCVLTHASWQYQRVRAPSHSLIDHIDTRQSDMALGWRYEADGVSLSLLGGIRSPLRGTIDLRDGSRYAIKGQWEKRIDIQKTITW